MSDFLQTVKERVVIYDGAMGTSVQARNPSVDDFWGKEGCNELLVLSRPDIIKDIHASFFSVGCDVVETDTFGGARVVLAEYDLQDKVAEINITAAKIAKEVAQQFSTKDRPRFVEKYRGSRYSFGYPACPNLEDQTKLFALLKPEENVGVRLTTGFLLEPEQSTSAIVVHHPAAKYFVV
jgi:hypothetical protein